MSINFSQGQWINQPTSWDIHRDAVIIQTEPQTDFWQRSYYGFRNDNAPALLVETERNFTFTTRVSFDYQTRFDQCGVIIYIDSENWFKAAIEYENPVFSRLGSVVTNLGYSDWATSDIPTRSMIWYRLSRREADFLIESSVDGENFQQMRIFHLHHLGETSPQMGKLSPPKQASKSVKFGLYACSPLDSSFQATFDHLTLADCAWVSHFTDI